jgi:subtilisin-like proprotein convertase family protein
LIRRFVRFDRGSRGAGCSAATGAPANPITVKIGATHTCVEDLNISLVSPGDVGVLDSWSITG